MKQHKKPQDRTQQYGQVENNIRRCNFTAMKVEAYIHSLKDHEHNRHVLGEAETIEQVGDNQYIAEYRGIRCTAIFNYFNGRYFVDDVYGILGVSKHA